MLVEAVNTREKASLRIYDRRGRTVRAAVRRLFRLMRCHLTGEQRPIHWRLVRAMYKVSRHYPGRTIYIYSGYRARKVASLRSSNHIKGRAVDLRVSGVSTRALRDYLMANFKPCGVGYYPNGPFVHFDVREKQSAFWVDYSGKGEAAAYAPDPYAVLKAEKGQKAGPAARASRPAPAAGADEPAGGAEARPEGGGKVVPGPAPLPAGKPAAAGQGSSVPDTGKRADPAGAAGDEPLAPLPVPDEGSESTAGRAAPP
jgi:uncharacterized protein YcbK (DUF882 family)